MNPELSAINNIDRRKRPDEMRDLADKLLQGNTPEKIRNALRYIELNPKKFEDLYSKENVEKDLHYVEEMEKKFDATANNEVGAGLTERDVKELSERVEYEVIRGINVGQWFDGVRAYKTSKYDDIKNGIDVVLEMLGENNFSHLGLGVDITFSQNIDKKFARIKDEIDNYDGDKNRLARVKYFDSPNTGVRGELNNITRVVIAVDLPMLKDMTGVKDAESLHGHISKHITLLEIQHQLDIFVKYALKNNPAAAKPIERAYTFINTLVEELNSENRISQSEYTKNRRADDAINKCLEMFSV